MLSFHRCHTLAKLRPVSSQRRCHLATCLMSSSFMTQALPNSLTRRSCGKATRYWYCYNVLCSCVSLLIWPSVEIRDLELTKRPNDGMFNLNMQPTSFIQTNLLIEFTTVYTCIHNILYIIVYVLHTCVVVLVVTFRMIYVCFCLLSSQYILQGCSPSKT